MVKGSTLFEIITTLVKFTYVLRKAVAIASYNPGWLPLTWALQFVPSDVTIASFIPDLTPIGGRNVTATKSLLHGRTNLMGRRLVEACV